MIQTETRLPSFNGLRAISILLVLLSHLSLQNKLFSAVEKKQVLKPFFMFLHDGQLGVNVFFVISGFLITSVLLKEETISKRISLNRFYLKRILRIFPAYYFLLGVYFLLQMFDFFQISNFSWLTSLTFTKNFYWFSDPYTSHLWSISVEEIFYLLWPLLFILGNKQRKTIALLIIFMVFATKIFFQSYYSNFIWASELTIFTRVDAIATGCLFALYKNELLQMFSKYWRTLFYSSLTLLFLSRSFPEIIKNSEINTFWIEMNSSIVNLFIAILMMYSVFGPKKSWYRVLNTKVFNYIGLLSYSLYLWQQFFIQSTRHWFNSVPINLVLLFLVAIASYHLIEKPFLKWKEKIT